MHICIVFIVLVLNSIPIRDSRLTKRSYLAHNDHNLRSVSSRYGFSCFSHAVWFPPVVTFSAHSYPSDEWSFPPPSQLAMHTCVLCYLLSCFPNERVEMRASIGFAQNNYLASSHVLCLTSDLTSIVQNGCSHSPMCYALICVLL